MLFRSLAYLKVILHASKFPYATVTGLLLGTQAAGVVTITDAIPLLHHWTDLSPMMEAGLQLVRSFLLLGERAELTAFRRRSMRGAKGKCLWACTSGTRGWRRRGSRLRWSKLRMRCGESSWRLSCWW